MNVTLSETWRDIPGYEGRYQASDLGRIRSLDRQVRNALGATRSCKGKVLSPGTMNKFGHQSVSLGAGHSYCVHALVLTTFVGPRPKGHDARHLDLNGSNNRLENLAWGTRTQNNRDVLFGGGRIVTPEDIRAIRSLRSEGVKVEDVARRFSISIPYVYAIATGRMHSYVD